MSKMKRMNKTMAYLATALTLALAAFCLASPAAAFQMGEGQGGGPHMRGRHRGNQLAYLTRQLNLTKDQQNKIKPILQDQRKQMMALRQDTSVPRDQKRAKFMEIRKNTTQQIEANLTPDQVTKFKQIQQQREQRMQQWRQQHAGEGPGSNPQNQ
jgi:periplasmic protein CpxP/Spy